MNTFILLISIVLGFSPAWAAVTETVAEPSCHIEEPEQLYKFQDEILSLPRRVKSSAELVQRMKVPLRCLSEAYLMSDDLLTKYVAGACLQRLMGAPEITGFKKNKSYSVVEEALLNQQLSSQQLFKKSEVADLASGKWSDYVRFCQGIKDSLCGEFLPTNENIRQQNELLGATSMLLLKSAFLAFKGQAKQKVADQIRKLYKETPARSPLKRRVIDQIMKDIDSSQIELRGS